jgi:hypothetical protein
MTPLRCRNVKNYSYWQGVLIALEFKREQFDRVNLHGIIDAIRADESDLILKFE